MRAYLSNVGRLKAEESLREIYDSRCEIKERIRQLMIAKTGDEELADRMWREMAIQETEALIDNSAG